jgi:hypothetical protein
MDIQVIKRKALGYDQWLQYVGHTPRPNDGTIEYSNRTYIVHPWISAQQVHVDTLGVELGDWVCGVRWVS